MTDLEPDEPLGLNSFFSLGIDTAGDGERQEDMEDIVYEMEELEES